MAWLQVLLACLFISAESANKYKDLDFEYIDPFENNSNSNDSFHYIDDMAFTEDQYDFLFAKEDPNKNQRKGMLIKQMLWPEENGSPTVPYNISIDDNIAQVNILQAMMQWEDKTCIRFRPATESDKSFINIITGRGCSSTVGRASTVRHQSLVLGSGCRWVKTILHELGHAIGFTHEMMRQDRDKYVTILTENIKEHHTRNFVKASDYLYSDFGVPFDYTSIMMYSTRTFTKNGAPTSRTVDFMKQSLPGISHHLTYRDIYLANQIYGCIDKWQQACGLNSNYCKNDGYLSSECTCACPPGTKGHQCEEVVGDYYDNSTPKCNQVIKSPGTIIQTPNFPKFEEPGTTCVYHIIAPENAIIEVEFEFFDLYEYTNIRCRLAALVILEDKINKTSIACGRDFHPGMPYKSRTNEVYMLFDIRNNLHISRGFKGRVEFLGDGKPILSEAESLITTTSERPLILNKPLITILQSSNKSFKIKPENATATNPPCYIPPLLSAESGSCSFLKRTFPLLPILFLPSVLVLCCQL